MTTGEHCAEKNLQQIPKIIREIDENIEVSEPIPNGNPQISGYTILISFISKKGENIQKGINIGWEELDDQRESAFRMSFKRKVIDVLSELK